MCPSERKDEPKPKRISEFLIAIHEGKASLEDWDDLTAKLYQDLGRIDRVYQFARDTVPIQVTDAALIMNQFEALLWLSHQLLDARRYDECEVLKDYLDPGYSRIMPSRRRAFRELEKALKRRSGRSGQPTSKLNVSEVHGWIEGAEIDPDTAVLAGPFPKKRHYGILFYWDGAQDSALLAFVPVSGQAFAVLDTFFMSADGGTSATVAVEELRTALGTHKDDEVTDEQLRKAVWHANKVLKAAGLNRIGEPADGFRKLEGPACLVRRRP